MSINFKFQQAYSESFKSSMKMFEFKILNRNSLGFHNGNLANVLGQDLLYFEYSAESNKATTYTNSKYLPGKLAEFSM